MDRTIQISYDQKSPKISSNFFLFDWLRRGPGEREDPGRRLKIFQNLYFIYGLKALINHGIHDRIYIFFDYGIFYYRFLK